VGSGRDGRVLIECHAGCTQRQILDALERRGIPRSELFEWSEASPKGEAPNHPALKTRSHEAVRLIEEWDASPVWRTPALRGLINAAKLLEEELPPVRWAVPDLVPEGVTLLAGKPKTGKSWLALGLCIATASGGLALGAKRVEEGSTLYLALEDNKPRLQRRLRKLGAEGHRVRGLGMATRWPRIGKGCEEALEEWLAYSPDARLVVIDTLAKIRPPASGNNSYAEDYRALEPLLPIAARHTWRSSWFTTSARRAPTTPWMR